MSKNSAITLLIIALVPAFGFSTSHWIIADANRDLDSQSLPSLDTFCAHPNARTDPDLAALCREFESIVLLGHGSVAAFITGILIPLLFLLASLVSGTNRFRMAFVFPPLVKIALLLLAIATLLQGAILTYGVYVVESYLVGRVHFVLLGLVGLGAVSAFYSLFRTALTFRRNLTTAVLAEEVNRSTAPGLWNLVERISDQLGARKPDNLIVGLEPTFFVTNADVALLGREQTLQGETLFVSTSLARLLSQDELTAVLGHELGHFRGRDTAFSMKFAPVYAGLSEALARMEAGDDEGASGLMKLPALVVLSFLLATFSSRESKVSRQREYEADQAAGEVAESRHLVAALIKSSIAAHSWRFVLSEAIEQLSDERMYENLAVMVPPYAGVFAERLSEDDELRGAIWGTAQSHPTDSHPKLLQRAGALGVDVEEAFGHLEMQPDDSVHVVGTTEDEVAATEAALSILQYRYLIATGIAEKVDDTPSDCQD